MRRLPTVVLALALAACTRPAEPVTVEVVLFGDAVEIQAYQRLADRFEAANPDVRVLLSPVARQDQLLARLSTAFAGGEPPDVFLANYQRYGHLAANGVLQPVQPLLDASTRISEHEFAEAALAPFRFDGRGLTCMPQNASSLQVYVNLGKFRDAGLPVPAGNWTWDEFLVAARAMTGDGDYGVVVDPQLQRLAPFVWSAGGEVVDNLVAPSRLMLDDGAARAALDWFLDLQLVHRVAPPDAEAQSMDELARFAAGRAGMLLESRRVVPSLRELARDVEWDVVPLPTAPGGRPATVLHGDGYCLAADGDVDAAWRFVEHAMSAEGQALLAASGRTVPSRTDVAASPAFLDATRPPASARVFLDALPSARSLPSTAGWAQVAETADAILADAFYGRVEREEAVRRLVRETSPILWRP